MRHIAFHAGLAALLALPLTASHAAVPSASDDAMPDKQDPRLVEVAQSDRVINSIAIARNGRFFVSMPGVEGPGPQVAELKDGKFVPFPNLEWSLWKTDADPRTTLMHVNTVRVGPDGDLWVVDAGAPHAAVEKVIDTWMAAGTAIDAKGNIYMSKVTNRSVMRIAPDGKVSTVVSDPRLTWIDAMWVTRDGNLYMPAAQLDRTSANLAGAPAQIEYPVRLYRIAVGAKPAANDHK